MAKKAKSTKTKADGGLNNSQAGSLCYVGKPSVVVDTRVIYCGDNLEQLKKLPEGCARLIYIDPPFNSNRNYEVFWGETKEKRAFTEPYLPSWQMYGIARERRYSASAAL